MTAMNNTARVRVAVAVAVVVAGWLAPVAAAASEGPLVRITRPAPGRVVIEVADASVLVRKDISAERSVVTMSSGAEELIVTIRRGVLSVSGPGGAITMEAGSGAEYGQVLAMLQSSEAARRARALLAQVTEGPDTFVGQSVLLTRALIEAGSGSSSAMTRHQEWVEDRAAERLAARQGRQSGRPQVIRVGLTRLAQQRGPGDCWDLYSAEAVRIASDFGDCTDELRWYEAHKWAGCSLIYAVRSEAAMAWFIGCNGGIPFSG